MVSVEVKSNYEEMSKKSAREVGKEFWKRSTESP